MSCLCWYTTPSGARLELHYDGRFWTERRDEFGTTLVQVDPWRASEHYELALKEGEVCGTFPMKLRGLPGRQWRQEKAGDRVSEQREGA